MSRLIFPGKTEDAEINLTFDFLSSLAVGETLTSASTTAAVYSGVDSTPEALIGGAATVGDSSVSQPITGGTLGVTYVLTCEAETDGGQTLTLSGYLAVVEDSAS